MSIEEIKISYHKYLESLKVNNYEFRLSSNSNETSPFALCFALFGLYLIGATSDCNIDKNEYAEKLISNLNEYRIKRESCSELKYDKPFLQLLAFTLSALSILKQMDNESLYCIIAPLVEKDLKKYLERVGVFRGLPQSGNFAMFMAVILIHADKYLNMNTSSLIDQWIELHLKSMNRFGFWGVDDGMRYLHFQNGYHQYEIFEYLGVDNPFVSIAAEKTAMLADSKGHFAPYPGGNGCYDYDAVFIITSDKKNLYRYKSLLEKTKESILGEKNHDGGFCSSHVIRPRSLRNYVLMLEHLIFPLRKGTIARYDCFKTNMTLQLPQSDQIKTHWTKYSREWNESNLWDSWFRMLTIARIQTAFDCKDACKWNFIDYPGIGYFRKP